MRYFFIYNIILLSIILSTSLELLPGFNVENHNFQKYGQSIDILTISINPNKYNLEIFNSSDKELSLKDISSRNDYLLIFNAGMFDIDYKTSMGYMKNDGQVLNSRNHPNYESILAFNPIIENIPKLYIYDSDDTDYEEYCPIRTNYYTLSKLLWTKSSTMESR